MNLRNLSFILFLFSCSAFVISCSKDDEIAENKTYELKEISWTLKDGDGQEIIEKKLPEQVFRNDGNSAMPISIKPLEGLKGTSQFFNGDIQLFSKLNGNEVDVSIPSLVELLSSSGSGYVVGGIKVPFRLEESSFPFSTDIKETTELPPHTELHYSATVYLKKITATYSARIGEKEGFDSYETAGKWTGVFFYTINEASVLNDIKH